VWSLLANGIILLGTGGPTSSSAREAAVAVLENVRHEMEPCWRDASADPIHIAVIVNADGTVAGARPKTNSPAARCAAAMISAAKFPAGEKWRSVVDLRFATDTFKDVGAHLAPLMSDLELCKVDDPGVTGTASVDIVVHGDGRITDIAMAKLVSHRIDICLMRMLSAMRLPEHRGGDSPYRVTVTIGP